MPWVNRKTDNFVVTLKSMSESELEENIKRKEKDGYFVAQRGVDRFYSRPRYFAVMKKHTV